MLLPYAGGVPGRHPTTQRLIREGMRLFAARGIDGTAITAIEAAAGLAPGSGAFYKHFRTKADLYVAAVADATEAMTTTTSASPDPPSGELRAEAEQIARRALHLLDDRRDVILVTMRDGQRLLRGDDLARSWPATGHEWFAGWLRDRRDSGAIVVADPDGAAVVFLGALTNYWLNSRGGVQPVLGVDEEPFIASWADLLARLAP